MLGNFQLGATTLGGMPVVVSAGGDVNVAITGVSATGAIGTVTVTGDANVSPAGVSATGAIGTVTVTGDANVAITGVAATGAIGTVTVTTGSSGTVTGSATDNATFGGGATGYVRHRVRPVVMDKAPAPIKAPATIVEPVAKKANKPVAPSKPADPIIPPVAPVATRLSGRATDTAYFSGGADAYTRAISLDGDGAMSFGGRAIGVVKSTHSARDAVRFGGYAVGQVRRGDDMEAIALAIQLLTGQP